MSSNVFVNMFFEWFIRSFIRYMIMVCPHLINPLEMTNQPVINDVLMICKKYVIMVYSPFMGHYE